MALIRHSQPPILKGIGGIALVALGLALFWLTRLPESVPLRWGVGLAGAVANGIGVAIVQQCTEHQLRRRLWLSVAVLFAIALTIRIVF